MSSHRLDLYGASRSSEYRLLIRKSGVSWSILGTVKNILMNISLRRKYCMVRMMDLFHRILEKTEDDRC